MKIYLIMFFSVLYLGLLTGCDDTKSYTSPEAPSVTTSIEVDSTPVGVGLGVIGGGVVVAAWIISLMGDKPHE